MRYTPKLEEKDVTDKDDRCSIFLISQKHNLNMSSGDENALVEDRTSLDRPVQLDDVPAIRPSQPRRMSSGRPRMSVQFARRTSEPMREAQSQSMGRRTSDQGGRRATFDLGRRRSSDMGRRRSSEGGRISFAVPRTTLAGPARAQSVAPNPLTPPALDFDLRARRKSIFIFWFLILFDSICMPLALYFGLWYGTSLSPNTVFSIVTAALGGISIFEYAVRFWRLFKKGSTCRVIGGRRSYLDWFHWNFSLAWVIIMIELIMYVEPSHLLFHIILVLIAFLQWYYPQKSSNPSPGYASHVSPLRLWYRGADTGRHATPRHSRSVPYLLNARPVPDPPWHLLDH